MNTAPGLFNKVAGKSLDIFLGLSFRGKLSQISETLSANPILDLQTGYTLKQSLVVGCYGKGCRLRMCGDPKIVVTDYI